MDGSGSRLPVVHVIDSLGGGGAEMALAELLPGLHRRGILSYVACLGWRETGVESRVSASGVPVTVLPGRGDVGRAWSLRSLVAATGARLVHTSLFRATVVGQLAAVGRDVPVLASLVNDSYGPARYADPAVRRWRLATVQRLDGLLARHLTDHFHAITAAVRDAAVDQLGIAADRVDVVPRGHDPARLGDRNPRRRARVRAGLAIPADARVVVTSGRHEYQKGQVHLLDALHRLVATRPDVRLLVLGRRGSRTPELEARLRDLGLQEHVHLLGYRHDAPDVMAAADVFAFPSLYEGQGNALVEAMGLGLPIVASDLPAVREVTTRGAARLVPPADPDALADALAGVLDDPARGAGLGGAGRTRFLDVFTLDRAADGMAELIHRVAGSVAPTAQELVP